MPLTALEARDRAADVTDVDYRIDLDLSRSAAFRSVVTVRFRSRSGRTFLDLAGAREVDVTVDGRAADVSYRADRLNLRGLRPGTAHEVRVAATLSYVTDGEGMHSFVDPIDGQRYVGAYLGVDLARCVFACFDQPDIKAVMRLRVTAEEGSTVLANGRLAQREGGSWAFEPTKPLPVNQFVVCAGRWASRRWRHGEHEFGWHSRQSLAERLDRDLSDLRAVTAECFDFYRQRLTPAYEFGDYQQIFMPEQNWGAQETPGCVMYREELLPERTSHDQTVQRASIIAHEMSHMWFGNLVTMRWYEDIWLNESFADYLGYRVAAQAVGHTDAALAFDVHSAPWAYVADARRSTHAVAATTEQVPDSAAAASSFDAISYAKGNKLLRQLALWLGDDVFFDGVNDYLSTYAFGNADLGDFLDRIAAHAGDKDVRGWARAWLRTTGFDTVALRSSPTDVRLERRGTRPHRLGMVVYDDRFRVVDRRTVELDDNPVQLPPEWAQFIVLPNASGETYARLELDPRSERRLRDGLSGIASEVERGQVWAHIFDELHCGAMKSNEFYRIVESHLPKEHTATIVQAVLNWSLGRGLTRCAASDQVRVAFEVVARVAAARVSEDGSTVEQFVDALARTADSQTAQRLLGDPDLSDQQRWRVIWRLAELGAIDSTGIQCALPPNSTAQQADWALRAQAAQPDLRAQRAAWEVIREPATSNRRLQAVLDGLWSPGRGELPDELLRTYLSEAPGLARDRGAGFAALIGLMHPLLALSPAQESLLRDALAGELEPRLRRAWEDWLDDLGAGDLTQDGLLSHL